VSSFQATIAMYQSRDFTEKRWWMPSYERSARAKKLSILLVSVPSSVW
jgi:hypothetical protein